ncbi:hypothetical protein HNV12_11870 [Methanococcoides sp. SA1]|nr:hypothetical protein [Methanococcoides sp. SA1]
MAGLNSSISIFNIFYDGTSVGVSFNSYLIIFGFAVIVAYIIYLKKKNNINFELVKFDFDGKIIKATYNVERNYENLELAHKIYIELITRKAAIPINPEEDVIVEVYDSWYVLFKTTREEIKNISGKSILDKRYESLIEMSTDILNKGLRPHLTTYQAKYRKWYSEELDHSENMGKSPQKIQQEYSEYDDLIESMKQVNELLIQYAKNLKQFINDKK